jgi:predicted TIM-barrel fold metal-dependent hydrolase
MSPTTKSGAIDISVHLYTPESFELGEIGTDEEFSKKTRQDPETKGGMPLDKYLQKMDRAGIDQSVILATRCGDRRMKGSVETPYERVYDVCQKYPDRLLGSAGIDPFRGMEGLRELERAVRDYGFIGAHFYPHHFGLPPNDAKWYPYYAKCCELDISVTIQVGNCLIYRQGQRLPSVARPISLDQVAIDFPDLVLVGSHIGWPWHEEMLAMAGKHPNIYLGLDGYAPKYWPPTVVHFANTFGQDKVVFGTDWPVIDPERAMNDVQALNFRAEPLRKILRENAVRILKLDKHQRTR